ncbi:MAG TPA: DUF6677 family protein [Candidatus Polarisedimenticolia bacterium]|nr:DUF6677 family protein [Candidatus Polarisedimenticolia bacterium]
MAETVQEQAAPQPPTASAPWVACLLAWLLPGLGHLFLGRKRRGAVFFVVVLLTLALGIVSDGAAALIDPGQPLTMLATFDNLALGPLELVSRYATYGRMVYRLSPDETDRERQELTEKLRKHVRSVAYEYGNTFLLTAGLMNILLILDAFDIATGRKD